MNVDVQISAAFIYLFIYLVVHLFPAVDWQLQEMVDVMEPAIKVLHQTLSEGSRANKRAPVASYTPKKNK